MKYKKNIRLIITISLFVFIYIIVDILGLRTFFDLHNIQKAFSENFYTGTVIFIFLFICGNIIQVPGILFLIAAVLTMGKLTGGMMAIIGANISCCTSYFLIKTIGGDSLTNLDIKFIKKLLQKLDKKPILTIFILRLFFQTLPALNYALALSNVKFRDYFLGTLLGLPLPLLLYCYFFDFLAKNFL